MNSETWLLERLDGDRLMLTYHCVCGLGFTAGNVTPSTVWFAAQWTRDTHLASDIHAAEEAV